MKDDSDAPDNSLDRFAWYEVWRSDDERRMILGGRNRAFVVGTNGTIDLVEDVDEYLAGLTAQGWVALPNGKSGSADRACRFNISSADSGTYLAFHTDAWEKAIHFWNNEIDQT